MKMEAKEVFTGLFPPLKINLDMNENYSSSEEDPADLMSDVESLDLDALDDWSTPFSVVSWLFV